MNYPKPLKKGDKVAIISPSTPTSPKRVEDAEKAIRAMGLEPIMFPTCYKYHGHLSGSDEERAKDVNDAFLDKSIKGIICLKGGSGATRILPRLKYDQIRENPKVFVGYSDITALHMVLNKICNMVTYHGPMCISNVFNVDGDKVSFEPFTYNSLVDNIFKSKAIGEIKNPPNEKLEMLYGGSCEGEIMGGNLSLLVATLGSPYEVDVKGKILFIEEVHEETYKIDKMLTALSLAGKFNDCVGILLGTFSDCMQEEKSSYDGKDLDLETIFKEVILPYKKPTLLNIRAGHNHPQVTIPFGVKAKMNADEKKVVLLEASTKE